MGMGAASYFLMIAVLTPFKILAYLKFSAWTKIDIYEFIFDGNPLFCLYLFVAFCIAGVVSSFPIFLVWLKYRAADEPGVKISPSDDNI